MSVVAFTLNFEPFFGTFYFLTSENLNKITINFLKTCSRLSYMSSVKIIIIEWMMFAQVTLFVKTVIKNIFTKAYFLACFGAFHHLRSANLVEITWNFLVNFYFICWLYRTSKNHEYSTLFALISFLQRNVFFF